MLDLIFREPILEAFLPLYLNITGSRSRAKLFHFYIFDGNNKVGDDTGHTQRKMEGEAELQMSDS